MGGSTPLPEDIKHKIAVINLQNVDIKLYLKCAVSARHVTGKIKNMFKQIIW